MAQEPFFIVARGPVPRDGHRHVMFLGPTALREQETFFSVARVLARDRPSPYGDVPFFPVARLPVPRDVEQFMKPPHVNYTRYRAEMQLFS